MILRYTDKVKQQINAKAEPAPFLHIGFDEGSGLYAIWFWDSREVIEVGAYQKLPTGSRAADNHKRLQKLPADKAWLSRALGCNDKVSTDDIKDFLTNANEPLRTIACLKAIVVIYLQQSSKEQSGGRNQAIDGIGFSRHHIKSMNEVARKLLKRNPAIGTDMLNYAKNVAPKYASQIANLTNHGIKYPEAESIERWLRNIIRR